MFNNTRGDKHGQVCDHAKKWRILKTALMLLGLQPSSDGFPEGLIDQRVLALGSVEQADH
jgi:hypothetical protein